MTTLPTEIETTSCQHDGGNVAECVHYTWRGETITAHELRLRQLEAR